MQVEYRPATLGRTVNGVEKALEGRGSTLSFLRWRRTQGVYTPLSTSLSFMIGCCLVEEGGG